MYENMKSTESCRAPKERCGTRARRAPLFCVRLLLAALLLLTFLTGCEFSFLQDEAAEEKEETPVNDTGETWALEPVFSYEIPAEYPRILVNQEGYLPGSSKVIFFLGENLPTVFQVLDYSDMHEVYQGSLQLMGRKAENGAAYGTFSDFSEKGKYVIFCEEIGYSKPFVIEDDVYKNQVNHTTGLLTDALSKDLLQTEGGIEETADTLALLLAGYEMYPEFYGELWDLRGEGESALFSELRSMTDRLLKVQDMNTGALPVGGASAQGAETVQPAAETVQPAGDESGRAEETLRRVREGYLFAAAMSKYGYISQKLDKKYAETCLWAASKAWKYSGTLMPDAEKAKARELAPEEFALAENARFFAAAELFRASNEQTYRQSIDAFLADRGEETLDSESVLLGFSTYLSSRNRVNTATCRRLMQEILARAEEISTRTKGRAFLAAGETAQEQFMSNMTVMSIANYVITNHEYAMVIENHIHYLLGRNERSEILVEQMGADELAHVLLMYGAVLGQ